jgi:hypothetical protein
MAAAAIRPMGTVCLVMHLAKSLLPISPLDLMPAAGQLPYLATLIKCSHIWLAAHPARQFGTS